MGVCQVNGCGIAINDILISFDNGKKRVTFCPNHMTIHSDNLFENEEIISSQSNRDDNSVCECCGEEETIQYKDSEQTFHLCERHLQDLIHLRLSPIDFKKLYEKSGNIYILHDDFYDPDTGEAFQPIEQ